MRAQLIIVIIGVSCLYLSCDKRSDSSNNSLQILGQFDKDVKASVIKRKERGDSIDTRVILDTLYIKKLNIENYSIAFAQYHTVDNKLDLSIVGIENFKSPSTPTFLLIDSRPKEYKIDSVTLVRDSVYLFCRSVVATKEENVRIGFDLKFNGSAFPWSVD